MSIHPSLASWRRLARFIRRRIRREVNTIMIARMLATLRSSLLLPSLSSISFIPRRREGRERERERDREAQESINNESLLSYYAIVGKKYITYCLRSDANAKSITLSGGRSVSLCDSAPSRTDGPRTQFAHRHLQTTITFCPPMPIGDVISHPSTWHQWNSFIRRILMNCAFVVSRENCMP